MEPRTTEAPTPDGSQSARRRTKNRRPVPSSTSPLSSRWLRGSWWAIREHLALSCAFVATRLVLHAAGLQHNFVLDWMFLSEPRDLRERLVETVYYFHAYPPGMDLLTGVLLELGGRHPESLATWVFCGCGLVLVNSLYRVYRVSGFGKNTAVAVALAFALLPQTLYFEHLYLYTMPTAALLALAAAAFHRGLSAPSLRAWLAFFGSCAAVAWIRSMFHVSWLLLMIGLAWWWSERAHRRTVLLAAAGPLALVLALYLKNYALFGVFGATSAGGGNLTHVTVRRLPAEVREAWVQEGKLSPYAGIHVYAGPSEYRRFFGENPGTTGVGLEEYERPSVRAPNYNHWSLIAVNRARSADALYCIGQRPRQYLGVVLEGARQLFEPSTTWHPHDQRPGSPHAGHRQLLGKYERLYNGVVHGFPLAPIGLYVFLPVAMLVAGFRARSLARTPSVAARARAGLLVFCLLQIAFVVAVSSLFTVGESSRYRFQVEAPIWLVVGIALARLIRAAQGRRPVSGRAEA